MDPAGKRMIIYNGVMYIVVENIAESLTAVKNLAAAEQGYMQTMTSSSITVKVSATAFVRVIAALEKLGEVTRKDIKGVDRGDARFAYSLEKRRKYAAAASEIVGEMPAC